MILTKPQRVKLSPLSLQMSSVVPAIFISILVMTLLLFDFWKMICFLFIIFSISTKAMMSLTRYLLDISQTSELITTNGLVCKIDTDIKLTKLIQIIPTSFLIHQSKSLELIHSFYAKLEIFYVFFNKRLFYVTLNFHFIINQNMLCYLIEF